MSDDPTEALRMLDDLVKPATAEPGLRGCHPSEARVIFGFEGRGRVPAGMTIFENSKAGVEAWERAAQGVQEYQKSLEPAPIKIEPTPAAQTAPEGVTIRRLAIGR